MKCKKITVLTNISANLCLKNILSHFTFKSLNAEQISDLLTGYD